MKRLGLFALICATAFSSFCFAEQETVESLVKPIQNIEMKELDFEGLPKESVIGNLAEVVKEKEEESVFDSLSERARKKKRIHAIMYPHAETLAYLNGQLCHVGNYPQSVIYTVLEGPYYGTQTTMTYGGIVLYVNYDYVAEYTPGGVVFHHYYSDSEVITGSNQVIKFN